MSCSNSQPWLQEDLHIAAQLVQQSGNRSLHIHRLTPDRSAVRLWEEVCEALQEDFSSTTYGSQDRVRIADAVLILPPEFELLDAGESDGMAELLQVNVSSFPGDDLWKISWIS